jgi:NAD(P)-dependent dehydrogenase (short-subunit alcohol dehydrogenase family)
MRLAGKVSFITGGNSGVGLATAKRFITEGAKVSIVGRNQATLREAAATLGSTLLPLQADLRDVKAIDACVERAVSAFGKIDIVFANAGASGTTRIGDTTLNAFNAIVETNLTGVFFTVQATASHMNDGGSIILNGSVHAVMGWPYFSAYAATKGAVRSMTRVMASEFAGRRIRVNQVTPGATNTPLWSRLVPDPEQVAALQRELATTIPLNRLAEADEMMAARPDRRWVHPSTISFAKFPAATSDYICRDTMQDLNFAVAARKLGRHRWQKCAAAATWICAPSKGSCSSSCLSPRCRKALADGIGVEEFLGGDRVRQVAQLGGRGGAQDNLHPLVGSIPQHERLSEPCLAQGRQNAVFRALVVGVLAHLDEPVPHQRPQGMGQRRNLDRKPRRQILQRWPLLTGIGRKSLDLREQTELRGLEVERCKRLIIEMAKSTCREPECRVRADKFRQRVVRFYPGLVRIFHRRCRITPFSHSHKIVEPCTIEKGYGRSI